MLASFLQPDPFNYFWGSGIGTNLGASVVWGFLAGLIGVFVARKVKAAWKRLHSKLDDHQDAIGELHAKLDAHRKDHSEQMRAIHQELGAINTRLATKRSGKAVE
jgi:hypothetical protein